MNVAIKKGKWNYQKEKTMTNTALSQYQDIPHRRTAKKKKNVKKSAH